MNPLAGARAARPSDRSRQERDHDLLSALVAIEGGLRALQAGATGAAGAADDAELVDALVREVSFARSLLAPTIAADGGTTDVGVLLAALAASERARGGRVDLQVGPDLCAGLPEARLHQVLRNLLDNARRHAAGAAVHLSAEADGATIAIRVRDEGPGIAADHLAAVTGRGIRSAGPTGGSGLGLHVATSIVAEAAGTLSIKSDPSGTTITVRVPSARGADLEVVR